MPERERVLMDFGEAMRAVQDRLAVRRECWTDKQAMVKLHEGLLSIFREDGKWHIWQISTDDIYGRDWMV